MEFIRFATFDRAAARIFSEADVLELEVALMANPLAGDLIRGAHGLRKLRRPIAGRGKRGGARVIYYFVTARATLLLVYAYAKNQTNDLPKAELRILAETVKAEFP